MPSRPMIKFWLRLLCAAVALVFGLLALASGVLGPEPIRVGGSKDGYYQIVLDPSPYWQLWAALGLSTGLVLLALPWLKDKGKL